MVFEDRFGAMGTLQLGGSVVRALRNNIEINRRINDITLDSSEMCSTWGYSHVYGIA